MVIWRADHAVVVCTIRCLSFNAALILLLTLMMFCVFVTYCKPSVHFLKPQTGFCQSFVVVLILPLLFLLFVYFLNSFMCVFSSLVLGFKFLLLR